MHPEIDLKRTVLKGEGFTFNDSIELVTIYQNDTITITYGIWRKANHIMPEHIHCDSVEHLLCTAGSIVVEYEGNKCILNKGDCLTIPKGISHTATSLEDNSILFAICIPPENAYLIKE
jgi:ethanolamine utilization protein EutQ (cupin superfamily)